MNIRIPGANKELTLCEVIVNPNPTGSLVFLQTLFPPLWKKVHECVVAHYLMGSGSFVSLSVSHSLRLGHQESFSAKM